MGDVSFGGEKSEKKNSSISKDPGRTTPPRHHASETGEENIKFLETRNGKYPRAKCLGETKTWGEGASDVSEVARGQGSKAVKKNGPITCT